MEGNFVPLLFYLMFSFLHLLCLRHLGIPGEQNKPIACRLEKDLGGHPHPNCNYHRSPPQLPSQPYVYIGACLYIYWGLVAVGPLLFWQSVSFDSGQNRSQNRTSGYPFGFLCLYFRAFGRAYMSFSAIGTKPI